MTDGDALERLDDALIRLRRFWSGPPSHQVDAARWPGVELSTVLVADAVHRIHTQEPGTETTVAVVAARLGVAHSTASRLVDRAVHADVVIRRPSSHDGRRTVLGLTGPGEQLVAQAVAHRQKFLQDVLGGWSTKDVTALAQLLTRLADAVHAPAPGRRPGEDHPDTGRGDRSGQTPGARPLQ